jgi:CxxC-x17-CxxC domain-containing protein
LEVRLLSCVECGAQFEFSADEQRHFEARGFAAPKRCRPCRAEKRRRQPGAGNGNGDGGVAVASPRREAASASAGKPASQLHPTTCTVCGAATEVPFMPDGVRPVYCLPCLKQRTR